jgi:hypothetical protein
VQSGIAWLGALVVVNVAYIGWGMTTSGSDAPVARPQLASIGPSLRLLAELPPEEIKPLSTAQSDALDNAGTPQEQPMQVVCHAWGPFNSREELEKVASSVAAAGGDTRVTQSSVPGRTEFLVYIGAPGKAENARSVLKELKAQSIDSALIRRGRFNNTLSVGVFSRNDRAERQRQRVAKLGYDAGVKEIDYSYDVFHLQARVPADFEPEIAPNGPCSEIAQAH